MTAAAELTLTTAGAGEPRKAGSAACTRRITARMLTARCMSISCTVNSPNGLSENAAALLTRTSSRPTRASTSSTILWGAVASARSAGTANAAPPAAAISATTESSLSSPRPTTATVRPRSARSRAVAAPIPEPPPVTIATRRFKAVRQYYDRPMRVLVVGAGLMGAQIGCEYALGGHEVTALARNPESAEERVEAALETVRGRGLASSKQAAGARGRIVVASGAGLDGWDLVVESVPEDAELKAALLRPAAQASPEAVIASNTSSLSIAHLGEAIGA